MSRLSVENLCVEFPIVGGARSFRSELLGGRVGGLFRRKTEGQSRGQMIVQALQNISFTLEHGDRLGLIGHNGAGKSTLLRTLAGCYTPTSGRLDIEGQVMPLLSLGCGMDGDFTGYDNIMLYGLYLGLSRKEIAERTADIADFTELGDFLNLPVRTYSSGMLLRLSFGVATSMHPDILLIDEVFGAGDARFYEKAKKRMVDMLERSSILVFASHSTALLKEYCNLGGVFEKGTCVFLGPIDEAEKFYIDLVHKQAA